MYLSWPVTADVPLKGGRFFRLEAAERPGWVYEPTGPVDPERRWVWIAPSWLATHRWLGPGNQVEPAALPPGATPIVEHQFYVEQLLARGFHVAGIDIGVSLGHPSGVAVFQAFYERVVAGWRLHPRPRLSGQSNGALMHYAWASRYPASVDRILGIYPATDLRSWPGLARAARGSPWLDPAPYDMTPAELEARLPEVNPIELLAPLAQHQVKIFHLHGDSDATVPHEPNSLELARRYRALGGEIELDIIAGEGHTPGPKFYESRRALDFLMG